MNVYKFETLNEFGYCKDPHTAFLIVRDELKKVHSYTVTDGFNEVPKADFRLYPVWADHLDDTGEVYYEIYGCKHRDDKESMLGVVKIEKFRTVD